MSITAALYRLNLIDKIFEKVDYRHINLCGGRAYHAVGGVLLLSDADVAALDRAVVDIKLVAVILYIILMQSDDPVAVGAVFGKLAAVGEAQLNAVDNARIALVVPVAEESGDNVALLLPRPEFVARFTGLDRPDIVAVSNILVETVAFAVLYYRALVIDMSFLKEIADIRGVDVLERHCGHRLAAVRGRELGAP